MTTPPPPGWASAFPIATAQPSAPRTFASLPTDDDRYADITCSLCLDTWVEPLELSPCGHIFCAECLRNMQQSRGGVRCPECRAPIQSGKPPNRILLNMAKTVPVKCDYCPWVGARDKSPQHNCTEYIQQVMEEKRKHVQAMRDRGEIPPPPPPWQRYGFRSEEEHQFAQNAFRMLADEMGIPRRASHHNPHIDRRHLVRMARWDDLPHSHEEVRGMLRRFDDAGEGGLTFEEYCRWRHDNRSDPHGSFVSLLHPLPRYGITMEDYLEVLHKFQALDTNVDGRLSVTQFHTWCEECGWLSPPHTDDAEPAEADDSAKCTSLTQEALDSCVQLVLPNPDAEPEEALRCYTMEASLNHIRTLWLRYFEGQSRFRPVYESADGWREQYDMSSNRFFYVHLETMQRRWNVPPPPLSPNTIEVDVDAESGENAGDVTPIEESSPVPVVIQASGAWSDTDV